MKATWNKFRASCCALMAVGFVGAPLSVVGQEPGTDALLGTAVVVQEGEGDGSEAEQAEAQAAVDELRATIEKLHRELMERERDLAGAQRRLHLDRAAELQAQARRMAEEARLNLDMQQLFQAFPGEHSLWIGVTTEVLSAEEANEMGLQEGQTGVVVRGVVDDSPAAAAGIQEKDVIVSIGDTSIDEVTKLIKVVRESDGSPMQMKIIRTGEEMTIEVTPGQRPAQLAIEPAAIARLHALDGLEALGIEAPAPANLSISIQRNGDEPATIKVEHNGEAYEVTSESIDMLPEEVQGPVRRAVEGLNGGNGVQVFGFGGNVPAPLQIRGVFGGAPPFGAVPGADIVEGIEIGGFAQAEEGTEIRAELDELKAEMAEIKKMLQQLIENRD